MDIRRLLESQIKEKLVSDRRIILLYGPRQVGKTTLARKLLDEYGKRCLVLNGEDPRTQELWESKDIRRLEGLVSGYDIVLLDEAQRIHEVGLSLKVLYDFGFAGKLFVTGSSSLDLASKTREPLTGRTWTFTLFPISFAELSAFETGFELDARREGRLP